ncbi:hypothetical protein KC717_03245, partial [Candidatus Dojkabacteria bacterium]|nr:hypothetical protein [Candidatus Dojkabacteria bacterium]
VFPITLALMMALAFLWVLNFSIKGERLITIVGFASFNVFILAIFFESIIFSQSILGQITTMVVSLVFVFILSYLIILTMNILNVSYHSDIPLGQAGRAASYLFSLLVLYVAFFVLFSNSILIFVRFLLVFTTILYFSYSLLWTLKVDFEIRFLSAFAIALAVTGFALVVNIWPVSSALLSFILAVILYVCLGVALEMKEKVSRYVWIEYGTLFIIIVFLLLLSTSWGINGHLI